VLEARHKVEVLEVWPENWYAVQVFNLMETQWRTQITLRQGEPRLLFEGLDYSALPVVIAACRHVPHRQPLHVLLPQLKAMELAAREVMNE